MNWKIVKVDFRFISQKYFLLLKPQIARRLCVQCYEYQENDICKVTKCLQPHALNRICERKIAFRKTKASLNFESNTSGSFDKPLNHGSFKNQHFDSLIAKFKSDTLQGIKRIQFVSSDGKIRSIEAAKEQPRARITRGNLEM
jgi:hypothetical protein